MAAPGPGTSRHVPGAVLLRVCLQTLQLLRQRGRHTIEGGLEGNAGHCCPVFGRLWQRQGHSDTAVMPCTTVLAATRQQGTSKAACWLANNAEHLHQQSVQVPTTCKCRRVWPSRAAMVYRLPRKWASALYRASTASFMLSSVCCVRRLFEHMMTLGSQPCSCSCLATWRQALPQLLRHQQVHRQTDLVWEQGTCICAVRSAPSHVPPAGSSSQRWSKGHTMQRWAPRRAAA